MGVGRMPRGARALAHPAGERGGERGDRAAARARAPADAEPRARPPAARRRRGRRGCTASARCPSTARSSTRWPSGSAPSSWRRDEGRARRSRSPRRPRRSTTWSMDPRAPRATGSRSTSTLDEAPDGTAAQGLEADPVPEARGPEVQGALEGGRERRLPSAWCGRARARCARRPSVIYEFERRRRRRHAASPTPTSTTCRAGRSARMAGPVRCERVTGRRAGQVTAEASRSSSSSQP